MPASEQGRRRQRQLAAAGAAVVALAAWAWLSAAGVVGTLLASGASAPP
ncbi:MAG TPA: hypothetical protein VKA84_28940 [Gemmatimonadaceae bacterium]|nr:hypothetical protein [Gemmatimonadaceae bacterium]